MNEKEGVEIRKEFQLERIVLFSDAIFAILITIMVIDLKVPQSIENSSNTWPGNILYVKFLGYGFTFFLVSIFWMRHVRIFGFLKDFNREILILNLLFLFSVSLFPFAISLLTDSSKEQAQLIVGVDFYTSLLLISSFIQTLITAYLIHNKQKLCCSTDKIEDSLNWKVAKLNVIIIPILLFVNLVVFNMLRLSFFYPFILTGLYGLVLSRLIRYHYPDDEYQQPLFKSFFKIRSLIK